MRFFEALLLIGNLSTFLLLVIPRFRARRWPLYAGIATVLILAAQVLVEGSRWQMVPAYALSGLLLLTSLLLLRLRPASHPTQVASSRGWRVATGFLAGLALIAFIFSSVLPMIVPIFHFANPSGPYAIGTLIYHWVDQNRADLGDKTAKREIMVQIWYPAEAVAVGTVVTHRPPRRSVRAELPHTAPA
jgi:predicted dienelactone hydrolase